MRALLFVIAAVLISCSSAFALAASVFLHGGYMYVQAATLQAGRPDLKGVRGWNVDVGADVAIAPRVSFVTGLGGASAGKQIADVDTSGQVGVFGLETTNYSIPLFFRIYGSEPGRFRAFVEFGPSMNILQIVSSATVSGATAFVLARTETKVKIGASIRAGGRFPLGETFVFETEAGYDLVAKYETLNMSNVRVMAGLGIVLGKGSKKR